jgi:hypothetical protein
MGHILQAVALLVYAASTRFAVPITMRIHEGLVWSNRDKRTLLDKMLDLLQIVAIPHPCYFVADAYYATRKVVKGLRKQGNHLVTRVKSNAVAYFPLDRRKGAGTGAGRSSMARRSRSTRYCAMSTRCHRLTPISTASVASKSGIVCVI